MMLSVCQANPDNKIDFMLQYMKDKFGDRASIGDKGNLQNLRNEVVRLQALVDAQKEATAGTSNDQKSDRGSEDESEASDEDDYVDILPEDLAKKKAKGPRASVSAEAFGAFNKKEDFKAKVIQKSEESQAAILDKLNKSFMFSGLDDAERGIVMGAMEEKKCFKKEAVIKEGEEGDCLYVVASGTLTCTKVFKGQTDPTFLKRYESGEAFGELALLYNAPRAASITSDGESLLYVLDRATFNHIVKDAAIRKREKYE
jgi:cAMP-dependent protein kinase regulator